MIAALAGALAVIALLLIQPRACGRFLIAAADAAVEFRTSWRRGRRPKVNTPGGPVSLLTPPPLDRVQVDTVSALKNYGMKKKDAEALVRIVGTAADVPALLIRALARRKVAA